MSESDSDSNNSNSESNESSLSENKTNPKKLNNEKQNDESSSNSSSRSKNSSIQNESNEKEKSSESEKEESSDKGSSSNHNSNKTKNKSSEENKDDKNDIDEEGSDYESDPSESQSNEQNKKETPEPKTNTEEIPKMTFSPMSKKKSTVRFELPVQNDESKEKFNIQIKKRSKSDDLLPQNAKFQGDDDDHEFVSEPIKQDRKNRYSQSSMSKVNIDPRNVPRRFSKMTIEQIDEVIEIEDRLLDAITFFNKNKDPSKLCEYYEIEETPSNIAQIFWGTKDINSNTLGQYLIKRKDMLDAYFMEVEMDKGPIQSLRNALLGPMRFDGESQTVHKVLSAISRCYASKNPDKCEDPDNMLDLYYALIMLNTDLSNPNNKTKMTLEEFIRNTKGANQYLSTLSDEELTVYYKNIQKNPLLFQNQSDDFIYDICPKIRGYLKKKSVRTFSTWTKKYFVLINSCLYYFSDDNPENAKTPLGALYLKGVEPVRNRETNPLLIRIIAKKKEVKYAKFPNGKKDSPKYVKGIKEIILEAPDRASSSKWYHRIRVAAQMSNFMKQKKESGSKNVYETDVPDAADDSVEECDQ